MSGSGEVFKVAKLGERERDRGGGRPFSKVVCSTTIRLVNARAHCSLITPTNIAATSGRDRVENDHCRFSSQMTCCRAVMS